MIAQINLLDVFDPHLLIGLGFVLWLAAVIDEAVQRRKKEPR